MVENFNIEIGKYTLESLTTGMYSDPKIIYREYIQNSVDSLEQAVESQLIEKQSMRIDIVINSETKKISVRDNGTGISKDIVVSTLIDIGNSKKRHTNNRGFRGIGRLGGMSYCNKLIFSTSADMEDVKTVICFNCKKLRELLVPGEYSEYDLAQVLEEITTIEILPERIDKHYFLVEMEDVSDSFDLLSIEDAKDYICQVAPIPYSSRKFIWKSEIHKELLKYNYLVDEFPIFVGENENDLEPVYKANRHRFDADRLKKRKDEISLIEFFDVKDGEEVIAVGWYGQCHWFGTLTDNAIAGMRVRKGNILIGDSKTLNQIYKQSRFNGWVQGELFILSDKLIPNARRDDFEQNTTYFTLIDTLSNTVGLEISKIIVDASKSRNDNSAKMIEEVEKKVEDALKAVGEGFNSTVDKNKILEDLGEGESLLKKVKNSEESVPKKEEVLSRIQEAKETVEDSRNFKINRISSGIDNKSRNILKVVGDILSLKLSKFLVDEIIEEIIEKLNQK
jgi:hypothetical protein